MPKIDPQLPKSIPNFHPQLDVYSAYPPTCREGKPFFLLSVCFVRGHRSCFLNYKARLHALRVSHRRCSVVRTILYCVFVFLVVCASSIISCTTQLLVNIKREKREKRICFLARQRRRRSRVHRRHLGHQLALRRHAGGGQRASDAARISDVEEKTDASRRIRFVIIIGGGRRRKPRGSSGTTSIEFESEKQCADAILDTSLTSQAYKFESKL
jgi:hypothetical protein